MGNRFCKSKKVIIVLILFMVILAGSNQNVQFAETKEKYVDVLALQNATLAIGESGKLYVTGLCDRNQEYVTWNVSVKNESEYGHLIQWVNGKPSFKPNANNYYIAGNYQKDKPYIPMFYQDTDTGMVFGPNDKNIPESEYSNIERYFKYYDWQQWLFLCVMKDGSAEHASNYNQIFKPIDAWTGLSDIVATSPGKVEQVEVFGLKKDGTVLYFGPNAAVGKAVGEWKDIVKLSTGINHVVGLTKDGSIVAAGDNLQGQTDVASWPTLIYTNVPYGVDYTVYELERDYSQIYTNGKFGYVDKDGNPVLPAKYRSLAVLENGYFKAEEKNNEVKIIDKNQKVIYNNVVAYDSQIQSNGKYLFSGWGAKASILTMQGKKISDINKTLVGYTLKNLEVFYVSTFKGTSKTDKIEGYYVLEKINISGKVLAKVNVDLPPPQLRLFEFGPEPVTLFLGNHTDYKYSYVNENLVPIFATNVFDKADRFTGSLARVMKNGKYGFIDKNGKTVLEAKYTDASSFVEDRAAVKDLTGYYGYIDATGKFVIPAKYEVAYPFNDGVAFVKEKRSPYYKLIDKTGKVLMVTMHTSIDSYKFIVHKNTQNGIIMTNPLMYK